MHPRWQRQLRPDSEVVHTLEQALAAARKGQLRAVLIVSINPLRETERVVAGELDPVGRTVLIGALAQAKHDLLDT